ncbi:MAG: glycosyltransferase family 9 protein [Flavobacteriia bacterium]|nr:glycosyltransferase family 9 protein [Flavobacteriia bacterium]
MKILAIRFSALGDVAMTIPVILEVLEQNPGVEIDVLTRPFTSKLFPNHPRLKAIGVDVDSQYKGFFGLWRLSKQLKSNHYDAVADLHFVLRSRLIARFMRKRTKVVHLDKGREDKKALTRKENKVRGQIRPMTERYADVFRGLGCAVNLSNELHSTASSSQIGFAPFAQHKGKAWPERHAIRLLEELNAKGQEVLLFGGPDEREKLEQMGANMDMVSVHKGTGIQSDIEAMRNLRLMVSMDSANMHLASLAGTEVVSIWGATHPDAGFLGYGQKVDNAVQVDVDTLSCRPCSVFGNVPCHRGDWACMETLEPEMVLHKISALLEEQ